MTEQRDESQLMYQEIKTFTDKIRSLLCDQNLTPSLLEHFVSAVDRFKENVSATSAATFLSIIERVADIHVRHLAAGTSPTKLEIETIELAIDWLEQLVVLHKEDLPEPKALVVELLYTFDLVERSQEAVTLAELVASRAETGKKKGVDPFLDDPEFDVQECDASLNLDPFAEDPGFGLEFDLLQRTINFVVETEQIGADPFNADPSLNLEKDIDTVMEGAPTPATSSYDVFADDPPPVEE